jgi:hypothetical protein
MKTSNQKITHIVGLGNGMSDGHLRITEGDNFHVYYGSSTDHGRMVDACTAINNKLKEHGRQLNELSQEEFVALLGEIDLPDKRP